MEWKYCFPSWLVESADVKGRLFGDPKVICRPFTGKSGVGGSQCPYPLLCCSNVNCVTSLYYTCISFTCLSRYTASLLEGIFFLPIKSLAVLNTVIGTQKNKLISIELKLWWHYYESLRGYFKELTMCLYNLHEVLKSFSFLLLDPLSFPGSSVHPQTHEICWLRYGCKTAI